MNEFLRFDENGRETNWIHPERVHVAVISFVVVRIELSRVLRQ